MEQKEINRYSMEYNKNAYDRLTLYIPKGTRAQLKAEATRRGLQSVNALLNLLISQILPPDSDGAATAPEPSGEIPEDAEQEPTAPTGAEADTEPED